MMQKDTQWFEEIYVTRYAPIRRYIEKHSTLYQWLPDESDDITQEAFLCLFAKRSAITHTDGLYKWLRTTAWNFIQKTWRDYFQISKSAQYTALHPKASPHNSGIFLIEEKQVDDCIQICMNRIGKHNMEILLEYYIDKCPIDRIAAAEGISPAAMHMRFYRWKQACISEIRSKNRQNSTGIFIKTRS